MRSVPVPQGLFHEVVVIGVEEAGARHGRPEQRRVREADGRAARPGGRLAGVDAVEQHEGFAGPGGAAYRPGERTAREAAYRPEPLGVRDKLRRLADRGWLHRTPAGRFAALPQQPA